MERVAGRVILLWGWRRAALAFLAGALAVLTQAPFDFFAAGFIAFPVLVWLVDGATPQPGANAVKRLAPAFAVGWCFGFGYFLAGLWWIGSALLVEADSFAWALPLAVVGIPVLLAFFYGAAVAFARLMWTDGIGRIAALAFGFGLAEWLRSFLFTGFPWNPIGLAAMPVPLLMQSVTVTGVAGMNALAVLVFAMPALLAAGRDRRAGAALATALVAAHAGFGYFRLNAPEPAAAKTIIRPHRPAQRRSLRKMGRIGPQPHFRRDAGAFGAEQRSRRPSATRPVAGNRRSVPLQRPPRSAGGHRRHAGGGPDADDGNRAHRGRHGRRRRSALLQFRGRHRRRAARSSTPSTSCTWCPSASIFPSPV